VSSNPLQSHVDRLSDALIVWESRDDTKAQPGVRQAATTAVASIDALLGELHRMRSTLVTEIRISDDAADARVDALRGVR
jgi:hypothetical protein